MITGLLIITTIYLILIGGFVLGFNLIKEFKTEGSTLSTSFSIVIPFRNESANLPELLKSLGKLDYPKEKFEVLLIDDDSEDDSVELVMRLFPSTQIDFKIINNKRLSNSPKKDAISTAIKHAKYDWIVTTDADCTFSRTWLNAFDAYIEDQNPQMIIAPVTYNIKTSVFEYFQLHDILSLQGSTIAGFGLRIPFLCNGANLAYKKATFNTLSGFEGNNNIASGDDIFLLEKAIKKYPKQVRYLKSKNAIVNTKPQFSLKTLVQQHVRWASKTSAYNNSFGKIAGFIVLLMNASIVLSMTLYVIGVLEWYYFVVHFGLKLIIDYLLIYKTARFFNQKQFLKYYILSGVFYPIFSVYVAILSVFGGYQWKGRTFRW